MTALRLLWIENQCEKGQNKTYADRHGNAYWFQVKTEDSDLENMIEGQPNWERAEPTSFEKLFYIFGIIKKDKKPFAHHCVLIVGTAIFQTNLLILNGWTELQLRANELEAIEFRRSFHNYHIDEVGLQGKTD